MLREDPEIIAKEIGIEFGGMPYSVEWSDSLTGKLTLHFDPPVEQAFRVMPEEVARGEEYVREAAALRIKFAALFIMERLEKAWRNESEDAA